MEIDGLLDNLRRDGALLAEAAERAGLAAAVPTCPDWRVRDLLRHIGMVHRWATAHVRDGLVAPARGEAAVEASGGYPDDAQLTAWFRDGHAMLVAALAQAADDLQCWTFLPAPSARAFWSRRQAHETAIHRVDAETAAGGPVTPLPGEFAADGVDELLTGFIVRPRGELRSPEPRRFGVRCADVGRAWLVTVDDAPVHTTAARPDGDLDCDCSIEGPASDLQRWLWNRGDRDAITVTGDPSLLDLWEQTVKIRWR